MTDKEWSEAYKIIERNREKMRDDPEWKARRLRFLLNANYPNDQKKYHVHLKIE